MTTPHFPGESTSRQYTNYGSHQEALWQALADSYYADVGGYAHCRMPTPGRKMDMARYNRWLDTMEQRWEFESNRDKHTRGLTRQDWPEGLLQYCYERMVDAALLVPPPEAMSAYVYDD